MAMTKEVRKTATEKRMREVLYALNRLIMADDECAPGGLADILEDDDIVVLWNAKEVIANGLGLD